MRFDSTRQPKYLYEYIVQGHFEHGWEDVTAEDTRRAAILTRNTYIRNDIDHAYRAIGRRTPNREI